MYQRVALGENEFQAKRQRPRAAAVNGLDGDLMSPCPRSEVEIWHCRPEINGKAAENRTHAISRRRI